MVFADSAPSLPCNWDVDTGCCTEWDTYSTELQTAAMEYGAMVVWAATGRRFGLCERTVRPCGRSGTPYGMIPSGYYWSEGSWFPYIFQGQWRNCAGCAQSFGCCSCEPRCQVWLQPPVYSIPATGITIGSTIYNIEDIGRVDDSQWLVRTDGECWPECQDYNSDSGDSFFQVTYFRGQPVPGILLRAAGELACEYARSCAGADCRLPSRVTSISRQGVSVSLTDVEVLLRDGLTGIPTVDQVILKFNPYRLPSRMTISSPDWPPVSRTVTYP